MKYNYQHSLLVNLICRESFDETLKKNNGVFNPALFHTKEKFTITEAPSRASVKISKYPNIDTSFTLSQKETDDCCVPLIQDFLQEADTQDDTNIFNTCLIPTLTNYFPVLCNNEYNFREQIQQKMFKQYKMTLVATPNDGYCGFYAICFRLASVWDLLNKVNWKIYIINFINSLKKFIDSNNDTLTLGINLEPGNTTLRDLTWKLVNACILLDSDKVKCLNSTFWWSRAHSEVASLLLRKKIYVFEVTDADCMLELVDWNENRTKEENRRLCLDMNSEEIKTDTGGPLPVFDPDNDIIMYKDRGHYNIFMPTKI